MSAKQNKDTSAPLQLKDALWFYVKNLAKAMEQRWSEHLSKYGVTRPQYEILTQLFRQDGLTQSEIAARCNKDAPTVTGMIDRMEREGLVSRSEHPTDRRAHIILLADKGKRLRDTVPVIRKAMNDQASSDMTEEEFEMLKNLLERAARNFTTPGTL